MNSANIQRNGYIDFVKGILIYLVVLGHAIQFIGFGESYLFWYDKLWKFIYTFHMPLFIAINGYFSFFSIKKNTYSNFFIKRVLALLVPMIAWCIISIIIDSTSNKIDSSIMMYNLVVRIEGLYWFIWAIIFYGFISSTLSKIKLDNLFTFIIIGFIIMFFSNKNPIFDLIESMYPFFVIGFQLAKLKLEKYYYWVQKSLPFLFVINILCILFWDKRTYIYITPSQWVTLDITIFRLFTGVVSSLVFLILTYYLYNIIKQFQILNLFISFGRTSLAIYLIQTILYYNIDLYTNFDLCKKWSSLIFIIPSFLLTYLFYLFYQLTYHNKFANFLLYGNLKK